MRTPLAAAVAAPLAALALAACGGGQASPTDGLLAKPVAAPALTGATIGGGSLSTTALTGSVVVVNFYASWCAPCVAETATLEQVAKADPTVHFVGVLTEDSATNGASFRAAHGVTYPSLVDPDGTTRAKFASIAPTGLPVTFVLDKQGKVAARFIGGLSGPAQLQQVITKLQAA